MIRQEADDGLGVAMHVLVLSIIRFSRKAEQTDQGNERLVRRAAPSCLILIVMY